MFDNEDKRRSVFITVVVHSLLVSFFFFYGLSARDSTQEMGISVDFVGSGTPVSARSLSNKVPSTKQKDTRLEESVIKEKVITQDVDEQAPVISKKKKNTL